MDRLLIIAASSDLSISYLESIKNDNLDIDVIVRDSSRIPENIFSIIDEIYEYVCKKLKPRKIQRDTIVNYLKKKKQTIL